MFSFRNPVFRTFIAAFIFLGHEASVNGFGMNLIKVPDDEISQVVCSMALLRKYYNSGDPLSGSVLYMSLTRASMHTQKKLLEAIHGMADYPWSIVIRDPKRSKTIGSSNAVLHEKPQCYFVVIQNLEDEDLEDIFEDWKITVNWNPMAQFVVYLSSVEETDDEMTELMTEILLNFMKKKIYNVNVIGQNEENGFYYGKSVFPYHPDNNCGNRVISIETLDLCDYHLGERTMDYDNEDDDDNDTNSLDENDNNDGEGGGGGEGEGAEEGENEGEGQDGGYENNDNKNDNDDDQGVNHDEDNENNNNNNDDGNEGTDENNNGNNNAENDGNGKSKENSSESDKNDDEKKSNDDDDCNNHDGDGQNDIKFTDIDNIPQESSIGEEHGTENSIHDDDEVNQTGNNDHYDDNKDEDISDEEPDMKNSNMETHSYESQKSTVNVDNPEDCSDKDASIFDENVKELNVVIHEMTENDSTQSLKKLNPEKRKKNKNKIKVKAKIKSRKKGRMAPSKLQSHFSRSHSSFTNPKGKRKRRSTGRYYDINPIKGNLHKLPKFMRLEKELKEDDTENNTSSQTADEPHFYFEEIFRALFLDKFPKDLSGCPLPAAYRPWEPYIFTETADITHDYTEESNTERNNETSLPSYNDYDTDGTANGDYADNGSGSQLFQFDGLNEYDTDEVMSSEDNREKALSGIEYQLLLTIGERLHMNIDLQVENTNLYHLFQELIDGDIEMVIGGIDEDPSMSQFVSTTIPYHQDDLTWCVAKARRSYSLFNFLATFSLVVWLTSWMYIIVASLTIVWMQRVFRERTKHLSLNSLSSVILRVYGSIINQSMPIVVKRGPLRLAFASTFFMSLIFINAYQSFLISTLTTPKSAYQIKRIEEIYQNRMTIKGSVDNVRHLNKEGEIFRYIREKFQMCYNIEECLMEAAENENVAVAVSRQHSFYNPRIPRNRLYCFDRNENIYVYLVTMLLPKKFHLLHKINPVIQHVIESGHMQKWARDLDMRRRILEERNHANDDKFRSLTIGQVVGTFVFAGALLGIALMALALECCVYRLATKRRRRRLKIVKFLHRKFLRA